VCMGVCMCVCVCVCVCVCAWQSDLDESASALKSAVEQAKRSANDVAHMSDELRQEQERNAALDKQRRLHEQQIKELQVRLSAMFLPTFIQWSFNLFIKTK